ncbi:MAG: hypothetical protein LBS49_07405 [Candidatus Accumulibacter sp.]|jgi:hypothetical protein|nr:hypothetical protein [Accumulibacter sp.]
MEALLEILCALIFWRVIASVGVSFFVALFLSQAFAGFTAAYCVILASFGIQERKLVLAYRRLSLRSGFLNQPLFLASWFLGSAIFGAVALVLAVGIVGLWFHYIQRRHISLTYLVFAGVALLSGFGLLLFPKSLDA